MTSIRRNRVHLRPVNEPVPIINNYEDFMNENATTTDESFDITPQTELINTRSLRPRDTLVKPQRYRDTNFV